MNGEPMAHGGATIALFDYILSTSGEVALGSEIVTAALTVKYHRPVPVPELHQLVAITTIGPRRSSKVTGQLLDSDGQVLVSGEAVIVKVATSDAAAAAAAGDDGSATGSSSGVEVPPMPTTIDDVLHSAAWLERVERDSLITVDPSNGVPQSKHEKHYMRGTMSPFHGPENMRLFSAVTADSATAVMLVRFSEGVRNSGGNAHGGAISAVFDHVLIQSAVLARPGSFVLTASLSVDYLLPVPLGPTIGVVTATTAVQSSEGGQQQPRRFEVSGSLCNLAGEVLATARASMVDPNIPRRPQGAEKETKPAAGRL
jgi:acyl-coenzyme A thioesterase PaaI-like protein